MSHPKRPSSNADFQYLGGELEVFAEAIRWKSYFASQLRPFIRGHVIEVGAGLGSTTRVLAAGTVQSWTCLEPDADSAARLQSASQTEAVLSRVPISVVNGSTQELGDDASFDTILYIDVLEHIEHDAAELARAARHLSPQGHLIVLSPAHQWLFSPFDRAIGHHRRYSRHALRCAGPADCQLIALKYLDSVGLLASLANRLVLKERAPSKRQIAIWDRCMVPVSRMIDPLFAYRLGKTVIGIWRRP